MNEPDDFNDAPRADRFAATEPVTLHCPYCGEGFDSAVDTSGGDQQYVEDCAVCCRPIVVNVTVDDAGELEGIRTRREND
jgi:hypothetical protein